MPRTLALQDLGLTQADVDAARVLARKEREDERRRIEGVRLGTDLYDETEIGDLIERVLATVPQGVRDATPDPVALVQLPPQVPKHRPTAPGTDGTHGSATSQNRPSSQKTMGIGYLGELRAGQWIELTYNVRPQDCWRSMNRVRSYGGSGDDSLGYDFLVVTAEATIMFEVKATTGDDMSFELGESEVRQAQRLTDGDDYRIIHITHVSDPDQTKLRVPPNPFGAGLITFGFSVARCDSDTSQHRTTPISVSRPSPRTRGPMATSNQTSNQPAATCWTRRHPMDGTAREVPAQRHPLDGSTPAGRGTHRS